jgi:hypothetical protein
MLFALHQYAFRPALGLAQIAGPDRWPFDADCKNGVQRAALASPSKSTIHTCDLAVEKSQ